MTQELLPLSHGWAIIELTFLTRPISGALTTTETKATVAIQGRYLQSRKGSQTALMKFFFGVTTGIPISSKGISITNTTIIVTEFIPIILKQSRKDGLDFQRMELTLRLPGAIM